MFFLILELPQTILATDGPSMGGRTRAVPNNSGPNWSSLCFFLWIGSLAIARH
jgi:hypothetical protein